MEYIAYHFTVTPPQPGSEILMALIADFGFESFDNTENGFTAFIKEEDVHAVDLSGLEFEDFTYSYITEKIKQTNWNEEWEKNFSPVVVENLLCIRAPFHEKDNSVEHEIIIMPKMSFGTGHHQTTQLMCAAMFETDFANRRVLDMGCGTGVLAILAEKLGASQLIGIDIDQWSVENSIENCENNGCKNISIKKGDVDLLSSETPFDIILANINKNILKSHMQAYSQKLNKNGFLFLSGFFKTDIEELVKVAGENALSLEKQYSRDEWAMLLLQKK